MKTVGVFFFSKKKRFFIKCWIILKFSFIYLISKQGESGVRSLEAKCWNVVFIYRRKLKSRNFERERKKTCRWCHGRQRPQKGHQRCLLCRSKQLVIFKSIKMPSLVLYSFTNPSHGYCAQARGRKKIWIITMNLLKLRREIKNSQKSRNSKRHTTIKS